MCFLRGFQTASGFDFSGPGDEFELFRGTTDGLEFVFLRGCTDRGVG
jgi:hypothetical protein